MDEFSPVPGKGRGRGRGRFLFPNRVPERVPPSSLLTSPTSSDSDRSEQVQAAAAAGDEIPPSQNQDVGSDVDSQSSVTNVSSEQGRTSQSSVELPGTSSIAGATTEETQIGSVAPPTSEKTEEVSCPTSSHLTSPPNPPITYGGKTNEAEELAMYENWKDPVGEAAPGVVLYMNFFVDVNRTYIPCEIGMASFSLREGLGLGSKDGFYWTLVDPIEAPIGYGVLALNNAVKYGIPVPGFSKTYQDYQRITDEIEQFLGEYRHQTAGYPFLFCSMRKRIAYISAMTWLYKQAEKSFQHNIFPLESMVVILSLGALTTLPELLDSVDKVLSTCDGFKSYKDLDSRKSAVSSCISEFVSTMHSSKVSGPSYGFMGTGCPRIASKCPEKYPAAMIGYFLYEQHVTEFLDISELLDDEELACPFHREELKFKGYGKRRPREEDEERPLFKVTSCALINAIRQAYLLMDALLVNYPGIQPRRRRHYPPSGRGWDGGCGVTAVLPE